MGFKMHNVLHIRYKKDSAPSEPGIEYNSGLREVYNIYRERYLATTHQPTSCILI
jgi:hypothetical protein